MHKPSHSLKKRHRHLNAWAHIQCMNNFGNNIINCREQHSGSTTPWLWQKLWQQHSQVKRSFLPIPNTFLLQKNTTLLENILKYIKQNKIDTCSNTVKPSHTCKKCNTILEQKQSNAWHNKKLNTWNVCCTNEDFQNYHLVPRSSKIRMLNLKTNINAIVWFLFTNHLRLASKSWFHWAFPLCCSFDLWQFDNFFLGFLRWQGWWWHNQRRFCFSCWFWRWWHY